MTTWANEMNFFMNHAPGAGSISASINDWDTRPGSIWPNEIKYCYESCPWCKIDEDEEETENDFGR